MRAGTRLAEFLLHFFSSARILMLLGILPRAIWLRLGWAFSDSLYIGCCCSPADLVHFLLELCSVASHTVWWAHGAWGGVGHGFRAAGSLGVPCNELKPKPVCAPVTRPSGRVARALAWLSLCSHGHPSKLRFKQLSLPHTRRPRTALSPRCPGHMHRARRGTWAGRSAGGATTA